MTRLQRNDRLEVQDKTVTYVGLSEKNYDVFLVCYLFGKNYRAPMKCSISKESRGWCHSCTIRDCVQWTRPSRRRLIRQHTVISYFEWFQYLFIFNYAFSDIFGSIINFNPLSPLILTGKKTHLNKTGLFVHVCKLCVSLLAAMFVYIGDNISCIHTLTSSL